MLSLEESRCLEETHRLEKNYQTILEKIALAEKAALATKSFSGKPSVTLIAVSKGQPVEAVEKLYRLGHRDFGENYVQELLDKEVELQRRGCPDIRWHFIGHLQTNKVKALMSKASKVSQAFEASKVACIHTIDSERLASEMNRRWLALGCSEPLPVFIEVNMGGEPAKSGLPPAGIQGFVEKFGILFAGLRVLGLMCVPPQGGDSKAFFGRLRELEMSCRPGSGGMLSMGMTADFETAIREGATHVRVGSGIFGARRK